MNVGVYTQNLLDEFYKEQIKYANGEIGKKEIDDIIRQLKKHSSTVNEAIDMYRLVQKEVEKERG